MLSLERETPPDHALAAACPLCLSIFSSTIGITWAVTRWMGCAETDESSSAASQRTPHRAKRKTKKRAPLPCSLSDGRAPWKMAVACSEWCARGMGMDVQGSRKVLPVALTGPKRASTGGSERRIGRRVPGIRSARPRPVCSPHGRGPHGPSRPSLVCSVSRKRLRRLRCPRHSRSALGCLAPFARRHGSTTPAPRAPFTPSQNTLVSGTDWRRCARHRRRRRARTTHPLAATIQRPWHTSRE